MTSLVEVPKDGARVAAQAVSLGPVTTDNRRLSIAESAALIERADVLVGADSGPVHLAAAVDTPVSSLCTRT